MTQLNFKTKISLPLVVYIVLGMMLGGGIFVYTGIVFDMTGPALPLAYLLAVIPVFISMMPLAMLGATVPVSGANYYYPSRMVSPGLAFSAVWVYALASFFGQIPLYVIACGTFIKAVFPDINVTMVAIALVSLFYLINLLGIKQAAKLQGVLILVLIVSLMVFIATGSVKIDPSAFHGFMDKGSGGLILGMGLLTFTYFGANGIIELGSEIRDPGKSIPRSFFIAFPIVMLLYAGVAWVTVGTVSSDILLSNEDPLVQAARNNMHAAIFTAFIFGGAVLALLTTLNALFIIGTRSLLMIVKDGFLPGWLGKLKGKNEVPVTLLTVIWILSVCGIVSGFSLETFASYAAIGGLFIFFPILLAAFRFPKKFPMLYRNSPFRIPRFWLNITVLVGVLMVLFFSVIILYDMDSWLKVAIFLLFIGSGFLYYYLRNKWLIRKGRPADFSFDVPNSLTDSEH